MSAIANTNPAIPSVGSLSAAPPPTPPAPVARDNDPAAVDPASKPELPKGVGGKLDVRT